MFFIHIDDRAGLAEVEQHAAVLRQALAEHQAAGAQLVRVGDLHGEYEGVRLGGDGQRLDLGQRRLLGMDGGAAGGRGR